MGCGGLLANATTCGLRSDRAKQAGATRLASGHGQPLLLYRPGCRHYFMHTEVRLVTPEDARLILETNTRNRPLNAAHVSMFEAQLKRGEMQITHQGIAISENNTLLDGQHRLMAIANTGISANLMVTTGLPESVFAVLDTGSKRTAGDILGINGAKNSTAMASGIRLYLYYREIPHIVWTGKVPNQIGTTTNINKEYRKDIDGWEWAAAAANQSVFQRICTPGPMSCLLYSASFDCEFSRNYLETFAKQVKTGDNLSPGSPILAYRNKMIAAPSSTPQSRLADYIKLLNAYATGQQLKIFKSQLYPPMPSLVHASESIHENAML